MWRHLLPSYFYLIEDVHKAIDNPANGISTHTTKLSASLVFYFNIGTFWQMTFTTLASAIGTF